jgi:CRP-like cAMP-binding protein
LRQTVETLGDRAFLSLESRLAKMLLQLAGAYGQDTDGGTRIELKLSQRVLGEMLGASRESVNKQLQAWSGQGILRLERGHLVLLRADALGGIVGVH